MAAMSDVMMPSAFPFIRRAAQNVPNDSNNGGEHKDRQHPL